MAPTTKLEKADAKEPAAAPTKAKLKLNLGAPKAEAEVPETGAKGKTTDEEFLLTLLDTVKVDHGTASKSLGITKAACRMRFIRLQQKHGFKVKGKGTPRHKQAKVSNEEETTGEGAEKDEATEN
ncbi:unnamed protein product [Penicillium palitans]